MRAHSPRRFGTTTSSRPPAASTRHASRSSTAGSCVISNACTSSTRSTALSGSGSSFSSTRADKAGRVVGHFTTRPALSALVDENELPLPDNAVDRVLLVHALEMTHDPAVLLREAWRVLAAGGRLLVVVPNRRGLWARMDTTPFGHGRPYSRSQINQLLRETWFTPTGWSEALY